MVKSVMSCGQISPLEQLPADWQEGQPLRIEKADYSYAPAIRPSAWNKDVSHTFVRPQGPGKEYSMAPGERISEENLKSFC